MNKVSDKTNHTVVKIFINTLAAGSLLVPALALAQTTPTPATPSIPAFSVEDPSVKKAQLCLSYSEKIADSKRKIAETCRDAGIGASSNCVSKAEQCAEKLGEEEETPVNAPTVMGALGMLASNYGIEMPSASNPSGGCPQIAAKDYFTEKEKIEERLEKVKEDIAKLDEERANAKEDYDKRAEEIQKELSEAQEKAKEENVKISEDVAEQVAKFQESQAAAEQGKRDKEMQKLDLNARLSELDRQKATALIDLTNDRATFECMSEVRERNKSYQSVNAGTSSGHITRGNAKKKYLQDTYESCMKRFRQKRVTLTQSYAEQRLKIEKSVTNNDAEVDAINKGLEQAEAQVAQFKQNGETRKANALQKVIDLGKQSEASLAAAYTKLQTMNQSFAKKEQALNETLNRANKSLAGLGEEPKSRTGTISPGGAASVIDSEIDNIASYANAAGADCKDVQSAAQSTLKSLGKGSKLKSTR